MLTVLSTFNQKILAQSPKDVASKNYALRLANKFYTNGYEIIKADDAKTVAFWMDQKTSDIGPSEFGTTVHECLHAYDHKIGSDVGYNDDLDRWTQGFFIDRGIKLTLARPEVFATSTLHPKHYPAKLQKASRYNTYVTGTASSNDRGIYGLMEEFNAYQHGNRAMYEMLKAGEKMRFNGEVSENITSNIVSSYFEFNSFMAGYLKYAKKHEKPTYNQLMRDKKFRLVYTLIETNWRDVLTDIYSDPAIAKHFPDWDGEDQLFNAELKEIMETFMLHNEELGKYQAYVKAHKYDPELILKNRRSPSERNELLTVHQKTSHLLDPENDTDQFTKNDSKDDLEDNDELAWADDADTWGEEEDEFELEDEDDKSTSLQVGVRQPGYHYVVIQTFSTLRELIMAQWNSAAIVRKSGNAIKEDGNGYHLYLFKSKDPALAKQRANALRSEFGNVRVL